MVLRAEAPNPPAPPERPEIVSLPIVGRVAAGVPITAAENLEDTFVLPAEFRAPLGAFMLRVKGDSMIDAAILDGDLIVVEPQPDRDQRRDRGRDDRRRGDGQTVLPRSGPHPAAAGESSMEPIYVDDVTVVGRVEAVVRRL
jgi:repressor LexA